MNRTKSSYIRAGLWGEPQTESVVKTKSFIVKNRSQNSLLKPPTLVAPGRSHFVNLSDENNIAENPEAKIKREMQTNIEKMQNTYNKIFMILIDRLEQRYNTDKIKKDRRKIEYQALFKQISKDINLMLNKYGKRRTEMLYEVMSSKNQEKIENIEQKINAQMGNKFEKFMAIINSQFQASFDFPQELLQTKEFVHLKPTDVGRNHLIYGEANQFMRQIIFMDFIEQTLQIENFIDKTFHYYCKDLANLLERIKNAKPDDLQILNSIKSILKERLHHLKLQFNVPLTPVQESYLLKKNQILFNRYFESRFDYRLNNLKMAYMFYQIYRKTGRDELALKLITKAIDDDSETISAYLEFYIKYFKIYRYISELFPSAVRKGLGNDEIAEQNEDLEREADSNVQAVINPKPEILDDDNQRNSEDSEVEKEILAVVEQSTPRDVPDNLPLPENDLKLSKKLTSAINPNPTSRRGEPMSPKRTTNGHRSNIKFSNFMGEKENAHRSNVKNPSSSAKKKRPNSRAKQWDQFMPPQDFNDFFGDQTKPSSKPFPEFYNDLIDYRSRYDYAHKTKQYLKMIFNPKDVKEMLLEVATHAMRAQQYEKAEIYFTYIIYMFENIDVFKLYKENSKKKKSNDTKDFNKDPSKEPDLMEINKDDRLAKKKESIMRTYDLLKLNEKMFLVNNYYISLCIRNKKFLKALIFFTNNHYIYKNSMRLIDNGDPCKYAKKNPNTIIVQSFSDYHLDLEEKILFQKLFNFFKINYALTLEHHKVLWRNIKNNQGEVSAELFCCFRDILEKLEALHSFDRKSYTEILHWIKIKREVQENISPNTQLYVPFYLGYIKKKDHLRYVTNKIFTVNEAMVKKQKGPSNVNERQKFMYPDSSRIEMKHFIQETFSYQNKRENQIKEKDIVMYLDITNENPFILDLIFRVGVKRTYENYEGNLSYLNGTSMYKWILQNWDKTSIDRFIKNIRNFQIKIRNYLKSKNNQRRTQEKVTDPSMRPIELKKAQFLKIRNNSVMFINEFKNRFKTKEIPKSQYWKEQISFIEQKADEQELDHKEFLLPSKIPVQKTRLNSLNITDPSKRQYIEKLLTYDWKMTRQLIISQRIDDQSNNAKSKRTVGSSLGSSNLIYSEEGLNDSKLNLPLIPEKSRVKSSLPGLHKFQASHKLSSIVKGNDQKRRMTFKKAMSDKSQINQYFKFLKDQYEKSYIDQVHSISKISEMPFTFFDTRLLKTEQISINFLFPNKDSGHRETMIKKTDPIHLRIGFTNHKYHLKHEFINLVFDDHGKAINEILQETLKETNFKFYTIIPAIHKFLVSRYFESFFYNKKNTSSFSNSKYYKIVQEHLKKMGLVYSLILIEFEKIKLEYLQQLSIGLYNKFDLCYLQAFFFIIKYMNVFFTHAKQRSPLGTANIKTVMFDQLMKNYSVREQTASIFIKSMFAEKMLFYSIKKQQNARVSMFSNRKLFIMPENEFESTNVTEEKVHEMKFGKKLYYLLDNLKTSIYIFKEFVNKSSDKETLKVYMGCKVVKFSEGFVNFEVYANYDVDKIDEIAEKMKDKVPKLLESLNTRSDQTPDDKFNIIDDDNLSQVLLIKIAKKIVKFSIEIQPIGLDNKVIQMLPRSSSRGKYLIELTNVNKVTSKMEEFNENLKINFYHFIFLCICPERIKESLDSPLEDYFFSALFLKRYFIESLIMDMLVMPFDLRKLFQIFHDSFNYMQLEDLISIYKRSEVIGNSEINCFKFDYKKLFKVIGNYSDLIEPFIQKFFLYPEIYESTRVNNYSFLIEFYETLVQEGIREKILSKKFQDITVAINHFFEKSVKNNKRKTLGAMDSSLKKSRQSNQLIVDMRSNAKTLLTSEKNALFTKNFANIKREMQLMIYMKDKQESVMLKEEEALKRRRTSKLLAHRLQTQHSSLINQTIIDQNNPEAINLKIMDDQKFQIVDEADLDCEKRSWNWQFMNGELYSSMTLPAFNNQSGSFKVVIRGKCHARFAHIEQIGFKSMHQFFTKYLKNLTVTFYNPKEKWPLKIINVNENDLREVNKLLNADSKHFEVEFMRKLLCTHIEMNQAYENFLNNIYNGKLSMKQVPDLFYRKQLTSEEFYPPGDSRSLSAIAEVQSDSVKSEKKMKSELITHHQPQLDDITAIGQKRFSVQKSKVSMQNLSIKNFKPQLETENSLESLVNKNDKRDMIAEESYRRFAKDVVEIRTKALKVSYLNAQEDQIRNSHLTQLIKLPDQGLSQLDESNYHVAHLMQSNNILKNLDPPSKMGEQDQKDSFNIYRPYGRESSIDIRVDENALTPNKNFEPFIRLIKATTQAGDSQNLDFSNLKEIRLNPMDDVSNQQYLLQNQDFIDPISLAPPLPESTQEKPFKSSTQLKYRGSTIISPHNLGSIYEDVNRRRSLNKQDIRPIFVKKPNRIVYMEEIKNSTQTFSFENSIQSNDPVQKNPQQNEELIDPSTFRIDNDPCIAVKKDSSGDLFDGLANFNFHSNMEYMWNPSSFATTAFRTTLLTNNRAKFLAVKGISKFEIFTTKVVREIRDLGLCQIYIDVILYEPAKWANIFSLIDQERVKGISVRSNREVYFYNEKQTMHHLSSSEFNYFEAILQARMLPQIQEMHSNITLLMDTSTMVSNDELFFVKIKIDPNESRFMEHLMILNNKDFYELISPHFWYDKLFKNPDNFKKELAAVESLSPKGFFLLIMNALLDRFCLHKFRSYKKLCVEYKKKQRAYELPDFEKEYCIKTAESDPEDNFSSDMHSRHQKASRGTSKIERDNKNFDGLAKNKTVSGIYKKKQALQTTSNLSQSDANSHKAGYLHITKKINNFTLVEINQGTKILDSHNLLPVSPDTELKSPATESQDQSYPDFGIHLKKLTTNKSLEMPSKPLQSRKIEISVKDIDDPQSNHQNPTDDVTDDAPKQPETNQVSQVMYYDEDFPNPNSQVVATNFEINPLGIDNKRMALNFPSQEEEITIYYGNFNDDFPSDVQSGSKNRFLKKSSPLIKDLGKKVVSSNNNFLILNCSWYSLTEQFRCEVYAPVTNRRSLYRATFLESQEKLKNAINKFIYWLMDAPLNENKIKQLDKQKHPDLSEYLHDSAINRNIGDSTTVQLSQNHVRNQILQIEAVYDLNPVANFLLKGLPANNLVNLKHICDIRIIFETICYVLKEVINFTRVKNNFKVVLDLLDRWKMAKNLAHILSRKSEHLFSNQVLSNYRKLLEQNKEEPDSMNHPVLKKAESRMKTPGSPNLRNIGMTDSANEGEEEATKAVFTSKKRHSEDRPRKLWDIALSIIPRYARTQSPVRNVSVGSSIFCKPYIAEIFRQILIEESLKDIMDEKSQSHLTVRDADRPNAKPWYETDCILSKGYNNNEVEYLIDIMLINRPAGRKTEFGPTSRTFNQPTEVQLNSMVGNDSVKLDKLIVNDGKQANQSRSPSKKKRKTHKVENKADTLNEIQPQLNTSSHPSENVRELKVSPESSQRRGNASRLNISRDNSPYQRTDLDSNNSRNEDNSPLKFIEQNDRRAPSHYQPSHMKPNNQGFSEVASGKLKRLYTLTGNRRSTNPKASDMIEGKDLKYVSQSFKRTFVSIEEHDSDKYEFHIQISYRIIENNKSIPTVVSMAKKLKEILKIYMSEFSQKKSMMKGEKITLAFIQSMAEYFVKTVSQSNQHMFSFLVSENNLSSGEGSNLTLESGMSGSKIATHKELEP